MSKIVHASIDENKKVSGGKAGDQTGSEVCTRNWYLKNWQYVLRPKSTAVARRAVEIALEIAANPNVGYNQAKRNTLHTEMRANGYRVAGIGKCDTDCSAFVTVCYIAAGIKGLEYTGNAPVTSNMVKMFGQTGQFDILSSAEYLRVDARLMPGDVLVQPGHHTVMVATVSNPYKFPTIALSRGSKGESVRWLQWNLVRYKYLSWDEIDGEYGKKTERAVLAYQKDHNLKADGQAGPLTIAKLKK